MYTKLLLMSALISLLVLSCSNNDSENIDNTLGTRVAETITAANPTVTTQSDVAVGYSRHKLVEERTVDIPAGWELLTTDDETMSGLANAATDGNQALEDYFGGSENLEGLFRQGMLIMAMDLDNSTFEMTPNVSVFREKLEFNMSNDNFINLATKSYEEFGQTNLEEARLEINGKTTGRTLYADSSQ